MPDTSKSCLLYTSWRPKSNYSLLLSPVSTKMTFVTDDYLSDLGAFGVDPGDHFKIEGGASVKARAELPVMETVNLDVYKRQPLSSV